MHVKRPDLLTNIHVKDIFAQDDLDLKSIRWQAEWQRETMSTLRSIHSQFAARHLTYHILANSTGLPSKICARWVNLIKLRSIFIIASHEQGHSKWTHTPRFCKTTYIYLQEYKLERMLHHSTNCQRGAMEDRHFPSTTRTSQYECNRSAKDKISCSMTKRDTNLYSGSSKTRLRCMQDMLSNWRISIAIS